jgi:hypothetical protein
LAHIKTIRALPFSSRSWRAIRRYSSLEGIAWAAGNGYAMALRWQARDALRFAARPAFHGAFQVKETLAWQQRSILGI